MGSVIAMARCPFHDDKTPSLAIYETSYHCFGCKKSGKLEPWMTELIHGVDVRNKGKIPTIQSDKFAYDYNEHIEEFITSRGVDINTAQIYGIQSNGNNILLPCYDTDNDLIGYQKRNVVGKTKNKYITIPVKRAGMDMYPDYSYVWTGYDDVPEPLYDNEQVVVVESVMDALFINSIGYSAVALLGTAVRGDIVLRLAGCTARCVLLFDPDANVVAAHLQDKLNAYGIAVAMINTNKKPYELDKDKLTDTLSATFRELL